MLTARAVPLPASTSRQYVTGAAAMTLVVNTPAAAAGASATTSARSAFGPLARMPENIPTELGTQQSSGSGRSKVHS